MKIFISYSHKDADFVEIVKKELSELDIEVSELKDELNIGDNIAINIDKKIRESDAYIVILSKSYLNSKWSDLELMLIFEQSFQKKAQKKIFPILIEKIPRMPALIRDFAYADLTNKADQKTDVKKFVLQLFNSLSTQNIVNSSASYRRIKEIIKEKESFLRMQELDYNLHFKKQMRLRKLFRWSFLIILIISLFTSFVLLFWGYDYELMVLGQEIGFQNIIFYFLGFLTAIIPSLYLALKFKNKKDNGQ